MLTITNLTGNTLKKQLGAERVLKRYENKHKDGSGNFGHYVRFTEQDSVYLDGMYGRDKIVYALRIYPLYPLSGNIEAVEVRKNQLISALLRMGADITQFR